MLSYEQDWFIPVQPYMIVDLAFQELLEILNNNTTYLLEVPQLRLGNCIRHKILKASHCSHLLTI